MDRNSTRTLALRMLVRSASDLTIAFAEKVCFTETKIVAISIIVVLSVNIMADRQRL